MCFSLGRTKIIVGFPFSAVITLMLLFDSSGTTLLALASCFFHEAGHLIFMFVFKCAPQRITLGAFGMRIDKTESSISYFKEIIICLAGPAFNFILALLSLLIIKIYPDVRLLKLILINLTMGIFNLIPTEPLDGAGAIKNALLIFLSQQRTDKILNILSFLFVIPMSLLGSYLLFKSGHNFTLLLVCIYTFLYLLFKKKA